MFSQDKFSDFLRPVEAWRIRLLREQRYSDVARHRRSLSSGSPSLVQGISLQHYKFVIIFWTASQPIR
jgi:hypothetical protein